ncbi:MAG TPA: lipocalin-like domain-containing protein [Vicinamibacterales bacterium]|nr:lipocalin-like domain-containing protein [Vicinamibacterales bacterium]
MRRVLLVVMVLLLAGHVTRVTTAEQPSKAPAPGAQSRSPLEGVWKVVELSTRAPGADWTAATPPYLSVYIFTPRHYSYIFAPGAGPRRLFAGGPGQPSDAEKIAAYDSIVAGAGTYTLEGTTLTMTAVLHKNPNEMTGEPIRYSVEIEADRVRMTIANPPFAPGRERRTLLARVE